MNPPLRAGAASIDITPPAGLAMAGFGVRTAPAIGAHDPLTVRAVAVNDTAIVCADVLGLDASTIGRIRARCVLPADRVVIAALHNHGGPQSLVGRHHPGLDDSYMTRLEDAAVRTIEAAVTAQQPATLRAGVGADPQVAKNRRHVGGNTDTTLPVLELTSTDGSPIANVVAYACHPVVLGADNLLWTADYPAYVRQRIEAARPGTLALFLTGCTGDANTGHAAHASNTLAANAQRTFETAERLGTTIADCVLAAPLTACTGGASIASTQAPLGFARRETQSMQELAAAWRAERETASAAQATLLTSWIEWAERGLPPDLDALHIAAPVSALRWGDVEIVALPGEIFAETAQTIRRAIGNPGAFVIGFAGDNPGYIAPSSEFAHGGYEVDEAHRYYGMPATFAPGSAEALADAAIALIARLRATTT